jgi:bloom syndrome protein
MTTFKKIVDRENFAARQTHIDNLWRMVAFCENKTDCRRSLQLGYFGEHFDSQTCKSNTKSVCDNCDSEVVIHMLLNCIIYVLTISCWKRSNMFK